MKRHYPIPVLTTALLLTALLFAAPATAAEDLKVKITAALESVPVKHNGETVTIRREQDPNARVDDAFAQTARPCPPFCIQPMQIAPGVETIGEIEMLDFLRRASLGEDVLVIDSRTPDWVARGTIPGSINIPWTQLDTSRGADPFLITDILESQFGARTQEGLWDFSGVKTLVLFCNGMWCGQSPANIRTLLELGYPADKLKWYRGGMQNWSNLGLTSVKP